MNNIPYFTLTPNGFFFSCQVDKLNLPYHQSLNPRSNKWHFSFFLYRYDPGGGSNTFTFLEKVPTLFDERDRMDIAMKMLERMEPDIPTYHTQAIQREFQKQVKLLSSPTPPHVVRHIYKSWQETLAQSYRVKKLTNVFSLQ